MNVRVRRMIEEAIQSDGIEELFETGKHISVDIFSDEYMNKINAIQLPNTKIKILQRLLSQAIDEFKKVNKIMGVEFAKKLLMSITTVAVMKRMPMKSLMMLRSSLHSCCLN